MQTYKSVLGEYMRTLLITKEAMGNTVVRLGYILKEFDDFIVRFGIESPTISRTMIEAWRKERKNDKPATLRSKYVAWRQLARLMQRNGKEAFVPQMPKYRYYDFVPHIYTDEEISQILSVADAMEIK